MVYKKCLHNSTQIVSLKSEYQSSENYNCNEVPFKLLACGTCYQCVAVNWEFGVGDEDIEDALTRNVKAEGAVSDGWHLAQTARDRQRHLILNFGIYRVNESAQHADFEADFDVPNEVAIFSHNNRFQFLLRLLNVIHFNKSVSGKRHNLVGVAWQSCSWILYPQNMFGNSRH